MIDGFERRVSPFAQRIICLPLAVEDLNWMKSQVPERLSVCKTLAEKYKIEKARFRVEAEGVHAVKSMCSFVVY